MFDLLLHALPAILHTLAQDIVVVLVDAIPGVHVQ